MFKGLGEKIPKMDAERLKNFVGLERKTSVAQPTSTPVTGGAWTQENVDSFNEIWGGNLTRGETAPLPPERPSELTKSPADDANNTSDTSTGEVCQTCPFCLFVTKKHLKSIFTQADDSDLEVIANDINKNIEKAKLDSNLRISHFFAQALQEVGVGMKPKSEDLYYNPKAMMGFSNMKGLENLADKYGYIKGKQKPNEIAIGNLIYGGRNGNAKTDMTKVTSPQDGYNYRGRGLFQLTGRYNYEKAQKEIKNIFNIDLDIINDPDLLLKPVNAFRSAVAFWKWTKMYDKASSQNAAPLTKIINSATTSYDQRQAHFNKIYNEGKGVFKDVCFTHQDQEQKGRKE